MTGMDPFERDEPVECGVEAADGTVCTFEADYTVTIYPDTGSKTWDCPLCGYEHTSGWEPADDYEH